MLSTSSDFDRLDVELNHLFHELDQNSSDMTNTIMKNTKSNSYESNCERKYHDVPHQDDNSFVFYDYLEDQFNSRVVENDDGPTEPQMQSDYIYYYNQDKQEGGVFKQTTKLPHQKNAKMNSSSDSSILDSTGIAPLYEYSSTRTRKKRKKIKSEPGTHLSSTLNFPYKKAIQNIESNLSSKKTHQSGIWRDEGDNAELLEKHFNSTWQFKFMRNFYYTDSSSATSSMMRSLEQERTSIEEGKQKCCCDEQDMKHGGTTKETSNDLKDSAESVSNITPSLISLVVEDKHISIDDALRIATTRFFDAMDSTDKSRDQVFRLEDEIGFNRTSVWQDFYYTRNASLQSCRRHN